MRDGKVRELNMIKYNMFLDDSNHETDMYNQYMIIKY